VGDKGSMRKAGRDGGTELRDLLRVPGGERSGMGVPPAEGRGRVDLAAHDTQATPGGPEDKAAGKAATAELGKPLAELQERLWAASTAGDRRRVLLILQGMDTSGKGGTVKHVIGMLNPAGCRIKAFKAPTAEERKHSFLWRVERELPLPGELGIFDRSHYEDVLIARVRDLAPRTEIDRRYEQINRFEKSLAEDGMTVIKCFLHISHDQQRRRLLKRLDTPEKHWKFNLSDIDDRTLWPAFQEAYEIALARCSTPYAPWYLVPADRKWYRNWAVSRLLLEHLQELDPRYPKADFDVEECRKRLLGH
jgi:PPK2 family polyphosphate:nucleotide phosphotransferase